MSRKNGYLIFTLVATTSLCTSAAIAQESLGTCSSEKARQMELSRSIKLAPPPRIDPRTHRTYTSFDSVKAKDEVNRIDEWLWKNCRDYSNEMRTIEQQYM